MDWFIWIIISILAGIIIYLTWEARKLRGE